MSAQYELRSMANQTLVSSLRRLVGEERKITREILEYIGEVQRRRLYADLGYSSLFAWLVQDIGYSEAAAYRRIQAARLIRDVPEAAAKIQTGEVNLTSLSRAQSLIRAEEKRTGSTIDVAIKEMVLERIETRSSKEVDRTLASIFPEASLIHVGAGERARVLDDQHVRMPLVLTNSQLEKIERVRELTSHSKFGASLAEVIETVVDEFLERKDPLRRLVKAKANSHNIHQKAVTKPVPERDTKAEITEYRAGNQTTSSPEGFIAQGNTAAQVQKDTSDAQPRAKVKSGPSANGRSHSRGASLGTSVRDAIIKRDEGKCQFVNPATHAKCGSRFQVQVDHIIPRALGGGDEMENLRLLCRTHNLLMAERALGTEKMQVYHST